MNTLPPAAYRGVVGRISQVSCPTINPVLWTTMCLLLVELVCEE